MQPRAQQRLQHFQGCCAARRDVGRGGSWGLALTLGAIGLMGFLWSLNNGQHDDLEGAGWRAIADDEPATEEPVPVRSTRTGRR